MLTFFPEEIEEYAARHSTPLPPLLEELVAITQEQMGERARMLTGQVEGTLLQMMAAALPEDGQLITLDIDPKAIAIARSFFARSPHGHKIELRQGPALETLRDLEGPFDLVFIDADKVNYINYYEATLPLLSPKGLIAVDNALWSGRVLDPQERDDRAIAAFNEYVQRDRRVTNVILPVRDGIMLIRRNEGAL